MDIKELKSLLDGIKTNFEEFKKTNDERIDAIEKGNGIAEVTEKLEKIEADIASDETKYDTIIAEAKALQDRLEELEGAFDGFQMTNPKEGKSKETVEYEKTFEAYLRSCNQVKGGDPTIQKQLRDQEKALLESKDFTTTVNASGGYAVPEDISTMIHDQMRLLSPLRALCRVVQVGTPDYKELVNIHGENSGWVGETGTRNQSTTPSFRERAPTSGTLYAYPRATEESVDDVFFDIGGMIVDVTSTEFAIAEAIAFLSGNGTNKPTGMLNTAPTTDTDDASPARNADAFEYIALDSSSPTTAIDPDRLIDLVYRLRAPYRANASWIMNSLTMGTIRKLKDGQNQYLWAPGLQPGQPASLLGFSTNAIEAMDDADTVGNHPLAFGDFRRGYLIVDRVGLRITVDDNITTPGYINWYIRKRVGGIVLDNNAVKFGKYASS